MAAAKWYPCLATVRLMATVAVRSVRDPDDESGGMGSGKGGGSGDGGGGGGRAKEGGRRKVRRKGRSVPLSSGTVCDVRLQSSAVTLQRTSQTQSGRGLLPWSAMSIVQSRNSQTGGGGADTGTRVVEVVPGTNSNSTSKVHHAPSHVRFLAPDHLAPGEARWRSSPVDQGVRGHRHCSCCSRTALEGVASGVIVLGAIGCVQSVGIQLRADLWGYGAVVMVVLMTPWTLRRGRSEC